MKHFWIIRRNNGWLFQWKSQHDVHKSHDNWRDMTPDIVFMSQGESTECLSLEVWSSVVGGKIQLSKRGGRLKRHMSKVKGRNITLDQGCKLVATLGQQAGLVCPTWYIFILCFYPRLEFSINHNFHHLLYLFVPQVCYLPDLWMPL